MTTEERVAKWLFEKYNMVPWGPNYTKPSWSDHVAEVRRDATELLTLIRGEPIVWLCEVMVNGGSNFMIDRVVFTKEDAQEYRERNLEFNNLRHRVRALYAQQPEEESDGRTML